MTWSESLISSFSVAQKHLSTSKSIVLPCPDDVLWIVTDSTVKEHGIGSTWYVTRNGKLLLAEFFSAKLRKRQNTWIPCKVEALSIASSIKHFAPYLIQSNHSGCVLTDSKPCVEAFEKLCHGEFSTNSHVSTFLSLASQFQVSVHHLSGATNIPSDFESRNSPDCNEPECQVCSFVAHLEDSVVCSVPVPDVLSGVAKAPFLTHSAWISAQSECPDLRRSHAHLLQGTHPSKSLQISKTSSVTFKSQWLPRMTYLL